eukprot:360774-Chlamydomonas_euryale.AAC.16
MRSGASKQHASVVSAVHVWLALFGYTCRTKLLPQNHVLEVPLPGRIPPGRNKQGEAVAYVLNKACGVGRLAEHVCAITVSSERRGSGQCRGRPHDGGQGCAAALQSAARQRHTSVLSASMHGATCMDARRLMQPAAMQASMTQCYNLAPSLLLRTLRQAISPRPTGPAARLWFLTVRKTCPPRRR